MDKADIIKSLEIPESVYAELVRAANASGTTPVGWIERHLPPNGRVGESDGLGDEELATADAALDECLVALGHALGTDNEQIDADLARAYGDDHTDLYRPAEGK